MERKKREDESMAEDDPAHGKRADAVQGIEGTAAGFGKKQAPVGEEGEAEEQARRDGGGNLVEREGGREGGRETSSSWCHCVGVAESTPGVRDSFIRNVTSRGGLLRLKTHAPSSLLPSLPPFFGCRPYLPSTSVFFPYSHPSHILPAALGLALSAFGRLRKSR